MAVRNLADELAHADAEQLMWALLVEHAEGLRELHGWDQSATVVLTDAAIEPMREWLLVPDPVNCSEAVAADLDLLATCPSCGG